MSKHELVWEEEMYESIIVGKPREFLISFEGQVWRICIHLVHSTFCDLVCLQCVSHVICLLFFSK